MWKLRIRIPKNEIKEIVENKKMPTKKWGKKQTNKKIQTNNKRVKNTTSVKN